MLVVLTLLMMVLVAYAFLQEGLLSAFSKLCNVFLAGLVAFGWFEPLATEMDTWLEGTFLHGFEDALCLIVLFCLTLGILRLITGKLIEEEPEYHPAGQQVGSGLCGLLTGYLLAGFLVCLLQTLPWQREFLDFDYRIRSDAPGQKLRRFFPADRVWLAMMHRAGKGALSAGDTQTFDADGTFELRYSRLRRSP